MFYLLFCVCQYLAKDKMTIIAHPPYWQGSMLCEFFLSEHVKVSYKGRRFSLIQTKLQNMLAMFQTVHLSKCFEQRYDHWTCCINSQGDYSEGSIDWKGKSCLFWRNKSCPETDHTTYGSSLPVIYVP